MSIGHKILKRAGYDTVTPPENSFRPNDVDNTPFTPWPSLFKVGDVVRLKSGGPDMTVTQAHFTHVTVSYFADGNRLTDATLPPEALIPTTASASSPE